MQHPYSSANVSSHSRTTFNSDGTINTVHGLRSNLTTSSTTIELYQDGVGLWYWWKLLNMQEAIIDLVDTENN